MPLDKINEMSVMFKDALLVAREARAEIQRLRAVLEDVISAGDGPALDNAISRARVALSKVEEEMK